MHINSDPPDLINSETLTEPAAYMARAKTKYLQLNFADMLTMASHRNHDDQDLIPSNTQLNFFDMSTLMTIKAQLKTTELNGILEAHGAHARTRLYVPTRVRACARTRVPAYALADSGISGQAPACINKAK